MITTTTISAFDGLCRFINGTICPKKELIQQPQWNSMRGFILDFRNIYNNFPEIYESQKQYFAALEIPVDYIPLENTINTKSFVAVSDIIALHPLILHVISPQLVPMKDQLGYRGVVSWKTNLQAMMDNTTRQKAWQDLSIQLYAQKSSFMSEQYEMNENVFNSYQGE